MRMHWLPPATATDGHLVRIENLKLGNLQQRDSIIREYRWWGTWISITMSNGALSFKFASDLHVYCTELQQRSSWPCKIVILL